MWNDIYTCYVEWYMLTMLSSSIDTFSGLSCAFWSRCAYQYTNYCNSIPKISLTVWKIKISAYLDIDTNIMHVIIYKISIISSYWHWNILWTAITCTTISTCMKFCSYKWNKDLQQFSTEKMTWYEWWNISTILSHALSSPPPVASCIISYIQKEYTKWYNTTHIYFIYITMHTMIQ